MAKLTPKGSKLAAKVCTAHSKKKFPAQQKICSAHQKKILCTSKIAFIVQK
jgi:hypothetical protein